MRVLSYPLMYLYKGTFLRSSKMGAAHLFEREASRLLLRCHLSWFTNRESSGCTSVTISLPPSESSALAPHGASGSTSVNVGATLLTRTAAQPASGLGGSTRIPHAGFSHTTDEPYMTKSCGRLGGRKGGLGALPRQAVFDLLCRYKYRACPHAPPRGGA